MQTGSLQGKVLDHRNRTPEIFKEEFRITEIEHRKSLEKTSGVCYFVNRNTYDKCSRTFFLKKESELFK